MSQLIVRNYDGRLIESELPTHPHRAEDNFSEIIELVLPSKPGEQVKCKHLYGQCYRCNWWKMETSVGLPSPVISRSQFVRVTRTERGLVIDDSSSQEIVVSIEQR